MEISFYSLGGKSHNAISLNQLIIQNYLIKYYFSSIQ